LRQDGSHGTGRHRGGDGVFACENLARISRGRKHQNLQNHQYVTETSGVNLPTRFHEEPDLGRVSGQYYLKPGDETSIKFVLPHSVEMTIVGGIPQVTFTGKWIVFVENTSYELKPAEIVIEGIINKDEWDNIK
jgi:hypothetical protein